MREDLYSYAWKHIELNDMFSDLIEAAFLAGQIDGKTQALAEFLRSDSPTFRNIELRRIK